ncbi:MAG: glycoside hydrolase family 38 N-terminal domain-containing protein [Sulfobacillus sp.]
MDRRDFLQSGSACAIFCSIPGIGPASRLLAADLSEPNQNPNWASLDLKATVRSSSHSPDPTWGYAPTNVFGNDLSSGWQTKDQTAGAWIEVGFPEERPVSEIWILPQVLPRNVVGQDVYTLVYSRVQWFEAPRHVRIGLSDGTSVDAELRHTDYFQIITLPQAKHTATVRITIEDVWPKPGGKESGIGKVRVFPQRHATSFEIDTYQMYGVDSGKPVQSATLHLINPNQAIEGSQLIVSRRGTVLTRIPLGPIPSNATIKQDVWIPAPFEDAAMEFAVVSHSAEFCCKRKLLVAAYQPTYFDSGTFSFNCTCHNDLGWLDTQAKTADFRSADIILPTLKLLKEYPEFMYSMESTTYLMEFLTRHPELRDEMFANMRSGRFTWGASYVQCQEVHVGPEKLVRQFYFGRLWLKTTFPGVDTRFYVKTDPPSMTLQMPQILKRAGVKYCIQGRMPYGFYNWKAPDGSITLTYGYHYANPQLLLDPKGNQGWLSYAEERENYYSRHQLPRTFIYDYTSDYLPPQPSLPPYARKQNAAMVEFADIWNKHFQGDANQQIHPPKLLFSTPEAFLDAFTKHPLDVVTLSGDWPFAWAYYDEPGNREALLLGRTAHNQLLTAERMYAGLALNSGFQKYPAQKFEDAWKADVWPDHGWGGNHGTLTDEVYHESYAHSKVLSDQILSGIGSDMAHRVARTSEAQIPVVVFNPLSWDRTDVVECQVAVPQGWVNLALRDDTGKEIGYEVLEGSAESGTIKFIFVAEEISSVGYKTFYLTSSALKPQAPSALTGDTMENQFLKVTFGSGGIRGIYDKKQQWEVLRTDKFDGGEVLQFTAPGVAWEGPEDVTMQDFDRTSNHYFPFERFEKNAVRTTAVREAKFKNFTLRESFHLYEQLNRVDIDVEIVNWDGARSRELRVVFPVNLDEARLSYEVPFGTVEIGKNELDFSLLPPDNDTQFSRQNYGGDHALAFREAINWIDASSLNYLSSGCLAASDTTVHLFRDETDNPVTYPMLQHVLLSTRKSLAWNPEYWFTQAGNHRYRMSLMPHHGDWRLRYREAIGFNYPLVSFLGSVEAPPKEAALPGTGNYLRLDPPNLILTAMKKSEEGDHITIRFYEAEGDTSQARIQMPKSIRQAWKTNLIEENEEALQPLENGTLEFSVGPWEIVTIKVAV